MKDNNTKFEIAKKIIGYVGKFCVGTFFGVVAANITGGSNMGKIEKATTYVGAGLVGLMVGNEVENYLDDGMDILYDKYTNKTLKEVEELGGGV